jgi:uncharacterized protein YecE (DUF72 family)
VKLYVGTSGFGYKEWKGPFYPEDLPASGMLRYYAERLPAVEINNTFYRMPKSSVMAKWAEEVPESFRFVIKASQRITHFKRLKEPEELLGYLWASAQHLGDRLGPILFQLHPGHRLDVERLRAFLAALPDGMRAVFELQHASWREESVLAALRAHGGAALCSVDAEDRAEAWLEPTARFGYLRLRREAYCGDDLDRWVARVREQPWDEVYVMFKHEDAGTGPRLAQDFARRFAA